MSSAAFDTKSIVATVESILPLAPDIWQIILKPQPFVAYQAGQYLQIIVNNEAVCYSIANAPLGSSKYELHIRSNPNNELSKQVLKIINSSKNTNINLRVPLGYCHLHELSASLPILFIAGGTGIAPIKAMLEELQARSDPRKIELFWGARSQNDLYIDAKIKQLQTVMPNLSYYSVLPNVSETLTTLVLAKHKKDLKKWQVIVSGPYNLAINSRVALIKAGLPDTQIRSDAFI